MATPTTLLVGLVVLFGVFVAASYAGTTLALRRYFEDESPEWVRIEE